MTQKVKIYFFTTLLLWNIHLLCMKNRVIDKQQHSALITLLPELFDSIAYCATLQSLGRLKSTCRLLNKKINFNGATSFGNELSTALSRDFERCTAALISCAHSNKCNLFALLWKKQTSDHKLTREGNILQFRESPSLSLALGKPTLTQCYIMDGYRGKSDMLDSIRLIECTTPIYDSILKNSNVELLHILLAARRIAIGDCSFLYRAVEEDNVPIVDLLIARGALINGYSLAKVETVLMRACAKEMVDMVRYLLAKGADPNKKDKAGIATALSESLNGLYICDCRIPSTHCVKTKTIIFLLLHYGADVTSLSKNQQEALFFLSAEKGYVDVTQTLLHLGASINNRYGFAHQTALMKACENRQVNMVRYLLEKGADPNIQDEYGRTALHTAVVFPTGKKEKNIVSLLVEYNADVNRVDDQYQTPLFSLCHIRDYDEELRKQTVALLCSKNADVTLKSKSGTAALHNAAMFCGVETQKLLLEQGCDCSAVDNLGLTPLDGALLFSRTDSITTMVPYIVKSDRYDSAVKQRALSMLANVYNKQTAQQI